MKPAQAIFGAIVAALGLAAFVTVYDELKPSTQTPPPPNEAAQKANSLTPANSIARDFAVLPKSLHTTPATSIAQELADLPKSVHTVPVGRGSTLLPRHRRRRNKRSPLRPRRRCSRLALPLIRPIPQRCPLTLNPSTSARAMAAIVSTSCADTMPCGNASIARAGNERT
jgi:hypothetical protein